MSSLYQMMRMVRVKRATRVEQEPLLTTPMSQLCVVGLKSERKVRSQICSVQDLKQTRSVYNRKNDRQAKQALTSR